MIVPADSTLKIQQGRRPAAAAVRHLALGDPTAVPAGRYAKKALESLGIWAQLKHKVVAGADVRQALVYVETGAAEAGIVYATDAAISRSVKIVGGDPRETHRAGSLSGSASETGSGQRRAPGRSTAG